MPRAGLDRAAVIAAATALVDAGGLDTLTLGAVAARLGVRTPSLYNHLDGLPALRRELALAGMRALTDRMMRAAVGKAGDAAILAASHAYRAVALEHPGLYAASLRAPDPEDTALQEAAAELLSVVQSLLAPYGLSGTSLIHAIRGLRSVVHGFVSLEAAQAFKMPIGREASFQILVETFVDGLRHGRLTQGGSAASEGAERELRAYVVEN